MLYTKAFYNLLKFNFLKKKNIKCQPWQVEDLRNKKLEKLFLKLKKLDVELDKQKFLKYSEPCDTPEQLTNILLDNKKKNFYEQIYLIIFEIWRRLLPQKQSLSIFCDELDHRIYLYDNRKIKIDELIQDGIANLQKILDENVDFGANPIEIFRLTKNYCAHDLEAFIYNYISDQIDCENDVYAMELIDGFYPFIENINWFNFLRVKIATKIDIIEANDIIKTILKDLKNNPDLNLQIAILKFMVKVGDPTLFIYILKQTLKNIKYEKEFIKIMRLASDFYRRQDQDKKEKEIINIIKKRKNIKNLKTIDDKDLDYKYFEKILT
ncbi:MAG: hypothetical protein AMS24_03595 [Chlamydiae bacterium SM23_39]|nr:MAG: hypothetical protein AMS24_03595 [Chlamydiae bacterium SM23_39]